MGISQAVELREAAAPSSIEHFPSERLLHTLGGCFSAQLGYNNDCTGSVWMAWLPRINWVFRPGPQSSSVLLCMAPVWSGLLRQKLFSSENSPGNVFSCIRSSSVSSGVLLEHRSGFDCPASTPGSLPIKHWHSVACLG